MYIVQVTAGNRVLEDKVFYNSAIAAEIFDRLRDTYSVYPDVRVTLQSDPTRLVHNEEYADVD